MKCSKPLGLEMVRNRGGESLVTVMALGDTAGRENEVAHPGGDVVVTDPHAYRFLQHAEILVLPEVRVARDVISHHVLEEGKGAVAVFTTEGCTCAIALASSCY